MEEMKRVMEEMNDKLEEERSEVDYLKAISSVLVVKERQSRDEIHEAHKELIKVFRDLSGGDGSAVGVKSVGTVDEKPFLKACKQRFNGETVELEHAILVSKWQDIINNPHWFPFKRVVTGEIMKDVVDEEDEKLKNLKQEWGEDVMNAVKTALEELNEFNPSGRYAVPVLWDFEQGRQATLKEAIAHMAQQIKHLKGKQT